MLELKGGAEIQYLGRDTRTRAILIYMESIGDARSFLSASREVALTKVVTTVGKPGVQVASITKRPTGYVLAHVEGSARPTVNSNPLVGETVSLKNGDVIELAGTQMQFVQAA